MLKISIFTSISFLILSCNPEVVQIKEDVYKVLTPIIKDTTYYHNYVAEIQSVKYVEVRTRVKGYIEKIHVDEGQTVKEGQLLFSISSLEFEKELQKATASFKSAIAELKAAEVELINVKNLADKNIVSNAELDMIKAKVDALKANVEEAEANKDQVVLNLSFSQIKAPYVGVINRIPNKVGSLVNEGDMLTSISDNNEVFAYFNLSESDYLNYKRSDSSENSNIVELVMANNELYEHKGKIEIIESEFDRSTGNIAFRARFPNPDNFLRHGGNGKVIVTKTIKNAMLIPQKSTFEIQDKLYVFVMDKDNILRQRNVISSMRIPHFYIIESGISKEDKILFEGLQNVKDGLKITPKTIDIDTIKFDNGQ
jgi:RND family efflux transporter MFP subunit